MTTASGHRALRRARTSIPLQLYLVTAVTHGREPRFGAWEAGWAACRVLAETATWGDAAPLCWVLMPDHWHGVVSLGLRDDLPTVVNRVKARMAKAIRDPAQPTRRCWASAYHDRALRSDDDLLAVARYVVTNPVRAGLADRVGDYPFWDAVWVR